MKPLKCDDGASREEGAAGNRDEEDGRRPPLSLAQMHAFLDRTNGIEGFLIRKPSQLRVFRYVCGAWLAANEHGDWDPA